MSYTVEQRDAEVLGSTAAITYTLDFGRAAQHLVTVRMIVTRIKEDSITVRMPVWTPGSYKVRDYVANQGNVQVSVLSGGGYKRADYSWIDKTSFTVDTHGVSEVRIEYVVYGYERSVRTNHINRNHAFIVPAATLMYVEGRTNEMHHVVVDSASHQWSTISTPLSPVQPQTKEHRYGAKTYDILVDSPLEIGNHQTLSFTYKDAVHEVAVASSQPVDVQWLGKQLERIVGVESDIFGGLPYDRYVFIVQVYPGGGGGLEHARGSVNAVDPETFLEKGKQARLLSLLCHEFFHVWNVKRIRPIQLGPFDYQREVYTPMLWLAEGLTSYYDDLLHYRCGFATQEEYLSTLAKEHIMKLMRVPGRYAMSIRDSSLLAWVKLYQAGADGSNRFPSYYLAGGVVMLLLDLHIIAHTDGKRTLDHALRALWERYLANPGVGLTEDETIALMERATGVQFRDMLLGWLNSTQDLPIEEKLNEVGYTLATASAKDAPMFGEKLAFAKVPEKVFVGWTLSMRDNKVFVRSVEDASPAAQAGVGIDDEILAINNTRITSVSLLDQVLAASSSEVLLTAQTDGEIYTTKLKPIPELSVTIESLSAPTEQQLVNRRMWLSRVL